MAGPHSSRYFSTSSVSFVSLTEEMQHCQWVNPQLVAQIEFHRMDSRRPPTARQYCKRANPILISSNRDFAAQRT
jgi:hypothetical protein